MKRIKKAKIICMSFVLITLCCLNTVVLSQNNATSADEKREAEQAWEALIKAKGGREKLHSVTNMLREFLGVTRLDIFPDKWWGFNIHMDGTPVTSRWDAAHPPGEFVASGHPIGKIDNLPGLLSGIIYEQRIPFLLETKWNKPEVVRVRRIKKGKKLFDVIETIVEKERVDFVFEPEEMLVKEVHFYIDGEFMSKYFLSDYIEIDGIKMPQLFGVGDKNDKFKRKDLFPIKFAFNVEYDSRLFERPLTVTNRDAWKPQNSINKPM